MGAGVAAKQDRGQFLAGLGQDPAEALRYWPKLTAAERAEVVAQMARAYGRDFAKQFQQEADRHRRPDLVVRVTNLPSDTPEYLSKRGYKRRGTVGNTDMEI